MSIPRDNYVGEPDYPSPWTTKHPREGLRDLNEARIVSLAPDVCLTPVGSAVCAIPYPIVDFCGHDKNYTSSVRFTRKKAMVMRSRTTHVHGDKAGLRKGIKSGTVGDVCIPVEHADLVRAEGSEVIRHLDRFNMNNGNTPGEATFIRDMAVYEAPLDNDPIPGSLQLVEAQPIQLAQAFNGTMTDAGGGFFGGQSVGAAQGTSGEVSGAPSGSQSGGKTFPTTKAPNIPRALLRRLGIYGLIIEEELRRAALSKDESRVENLSDQIQMSNAGQYVIRADKLLGGRAHNPNPFSIFQGSTWEGKYGVLVQPGEKLPLTNDILSRLAGKRVDVRSMSDAEVSALLEPYQDLDDAAVELKVKEALAKARQSQEVATKEDEPEPDPKDDPVTPKRPRSVRVDKKRQKRKKCLIGPYDEIKKECSAAGDFAHHVIADMTYRLGDRAGKTTKDRIPNAPTEGEGEAICLTEAEHSRAAGSGGVHELTRNELKDIDHPDFPGTAPMEDILISSQSALLATKGIDKICAEAANKRAEDQVKAKTGLSAPGRTKEKPLPTGDIAKVLRKGKYP